MAKLLYQRLGQRQIEAISQQLSKMTTNSSLQSLVKSHPKLATALQSYSNGAVGSYYRTVGNARKECALLRFGHAKSLSGTLITNTSIKQPLYQPRYTAAVGFLLNEPTKIQSVHHELMTKTLPEQSADEVKSHRESIVKALKQGHLQHRQPRMFGWGTPRQDAVNESIMTYKPEHIAAIVAPKHAFNKDFGLDHLAQATTLMNSHSNGLEEGRLTAQIAYISAKLGDLPVLTFDGTQFDAFSASQDQWTSILHNIDANADNPLISELLGDESNYLYAKATGLQSAVMDVNGLEKPIDIHEFKEIGGPWTSLPINIGLYLTGKSN